MQMLQSTPKKKQSEGWHLPLFCGLDSQFYFKTHTAKS
jgi:hypothetical protein